MYQHLLFLEHVFSMKKKHKRNLAISSFTSKDLHTLNEILYNLLHNSFELTEKTKTLLKKHAKWIRKFVSYKSNAYRRNVMLKHPTIFARVFRCVLPIALEYFKKD